MRHIKLLQIKKANKDSHYTRERLNSICLGNDLICYFSNYKDAKKFMAETNRMLNNTAQELNRTYIEAWTEHRKIYLTYHKILMKYKYKDYPIIIEKQFDLMCSRSQWSNGNHFTFSYFFQIKENLQEWLLLIIKVLSQNKKSYNVDIFKAIIERLNFIEQKLKVWGQVYAENAPPCPYDYSKKS